MKNQFLAFVGLLFLGSTLSAQSTQAFDLHSPNHQATLVLEGTQSTLIPLIWTSGKGPQNANTNYDYAILFDTLGGDISTPIDNITKSCCASSFADSTLLFTTEQWASYLNGVSQNLYGKDFSLGDTLHLIWQVNLTAVSPGPAYEFEQSASIFELTFVRGQLDEEYTPVQLINPAPFSNTFIQGNPNQTVSFSWTAAYCPVGCAAASYDLMIDTVNGDFSSPYFSVSVPNNDSSWSVGFNTLNQMLKDTRTPENGSRVIYWKVLAYGNGQVVYSGETRSLRLYNGLLDNENKPFHLINPTRNAVVTLTGPASTQLNFKWERTFTPLASTASYFLVFDTSGASPIFGKPVMQFTSPNGGGDTAINLSYGQIDHVLDSLYPSWTSATMMWAVKALVGGTFYYPEESFEIEFKTGVIISAPEVTKSAIQPFPNPSQGLLQLAGVTGDFVAILFSIDGKKQRQWTRVSGDETLDLRSLNPGVYFLHVVENGVESRHKIVLKP